MKEVKQNSPITHWKYQKSENWKRYIEAYISGIQIICIGAYTLTFDSLWGLRQSYMYVRVGTESKFAKLHGRVGPWKSRLFWALKQLEQSENYLGPKKSRLSLPNLFNAQLMSLPRIKIIRDMRHIKNRFIGNFMQMRTEWLFQNTNTHSGA